MMKGNLYVIKEHQLLAYEINYLPSHNQRRKTLLSADPYRYAFPKVEMTSRISLLGLHLC